MNLKLYRYLKRRGLSDKKSARQLARLRQLFALEWYGLSEFVIEGLEVKLPGGVSQVDTLGMESLDSYLTKYQRWLPQTGDPIFLIIVFMILTKETPFSHAAATGKFIRPLTRQIVMNELENLEILARLGAKRIFGLLKNDFSRGAGADFDEIISRSSPSLLPEFQKICDLLREKTPWSERVPELEVWHRRWGFGHIIYRYVITRDEQRKLYFPPVEDLNLPTNQDFISYEEQREVLRENTERFVAGLPAQDILLYGDRGTGKSSTVRLMLNEFAARGLRLYLANEETRSLREFYRWVKDHPWWYVIFIDDISFDRLGKNALEFRSLMQGDIQDRPKNVIFYVTSNRRTIVRLKAEDTNDADYQLGREDKQEVLALSDRFGVKIWFQTPSQEQYLEIVRGLAVKHRIDLPSGELEKQALLWERWNNQRSPRTAQQFVRSLIQQKKERD